MIYICESYTCHFIFERVSEWTKCPDCGKEFIRAATKKEIEEFNKIQEESKK